jgi:hypothetical protein
MIEPTRQKKEEPLLRTKKRHVYCLWIGGKQEGVVLRMGVTIGAEWR